MRLASFVQVMVPPSELVTSVRYLSVKLGLPSVDVTTLCLKPADLLKNNTRGPAADAPSARHSAAPNTTSFFIPGLPVFLQGALASPSSSVLMAAAVSASAPMNCFSVNDSTSSADF